MAFRPVRMGMWQYLVQPHQVRGPFCLTCQKWILEDDSTSYKRGFEMLENTAGMPKREVLLRAFHHGSEEVHRVDLGSDNWDETDIERAAKRIRWFDPMEKVKV